MAEKILVVDDSVSWTNYHQESINKIYGGAYVVEKATSARDGYDKLYANLNEPYKLIITDLQMELDFEPKHAGEWFVEQAKNLEVYSRTPILIISATFNIRSIAERLNVSYLPKYTAARDLTAYKLALDELLTR